MSRLIVIALGAIIAIAGLFWIEPGWIDSTPPPNSTQPPASSRLTRLSPSENIQKAGVKPYLMLHIDDLKKCFPSLLSDARAENLVTLDDIMVEVEKVFLPEKKEERFHLLKFKNERGDQRVLRRIAGKPKETEFFSVSEKGEWVEEPLDPEYLRWPTQALFRHFSLENDVIEEEQSFSKRGRRGEQIIYKERDEHVIELELMSPRLGRQLNCNLKEPKAILCICDLNIPKS